MGKAGGEPAANLQQPSGSPATPLVMVGARCVPMQAHTCPSTCRPGLVGDLTCPQATASHFTWATCLAQEVRMGWISTYVAFMWKPPLVVGCSRGARGTSSCVCSMDVRACCMCMPLHVRGGEQQMCLPDLAYIDTRAMAAGGRGAVGWMRAVQCGAAPGRRRMDAG